MNDLQTEQSYVDDEISQLVIGLIPKPKGDPNSTNNIQSFTNFRKFYKRQYTKTKSSCSYIHVIIVHYFVHLNLLL